MPTTAVSLFSGCGGFDLGATRAGVQILWANDIDRHAAATYRKYFPDVDFWLEDIWDVGMDVLPQADILIGCYPCQGLSAAAWRKWRTRSKRDLLKNPENYHFLAFMRAIPHVEPQFVFIENVGGLQSSAQGYFFRAQKEMLELIGYRVLSDKLNARDYGAAQSRDRVFIVGVRGDLGYEYRFPTKTHGPGRLHHYRTQWDAIGGMPMWPTGEFEEIRFHGHYVTRNRKRPWHMPSYTIVAHSHHVPLAPWGEPMVKLRKDTWALQGTINRRLSWRECAHLQSFGDFEPSGNLKAKYAQIGNAVPPLMGELLVRPAVRFIEEE